MSEEKKLIKLYSAGGEGIIDSGYNHTAHQLIQVTGGSLAISVGTEVVDAELGDFIYVPPTLVFRAESAVMHRCVSLYSRRNLWRSISAASTARYFICFSFSPAAVSSGSVRIIRSMRAFPTA